MGGHEQAMTRGKKYRLGDLQLKIMRVLWRLGSASVASVQNALPQDELAYTTVATMLRKMEDRGLVHHREDGRKFIYEAAVSAEEVTQSMADDFVDRLFEGSLAHAVSHLLDTRQVSRQELARLEKMIRERKSQQ
jgi:predicted transcriptional regulator